MQNESSAHTFRRALTRCRCAVYCAVAILLLVHGLRHHTEPQLLLLGWLGPLVVAEFGLRALQHQWAQLTLYGLEWLAMLGLLSLSALPWLTRAAIVFVFLACNTALWGWRWLLVCAATGALMGMGFARFGIAVPSLPDASVDLAAGMATLVFVLIVCAVAHNQAQALLRLRHVLSDEKHMLLRYLPKNLPGYLAERDANAVTRQWLTVVFVDLVGFTQATKTLTADELTERLNIFLSASHVLAEQWGGFVSKFLGDGVLCVFPSSGPGARANAALQAVRFVQQLPGQFSQWPNAVLQVTGGVASGECCTGAWGGQSRRDFTVIGAPVNLACRLQGQAGRYAGLLLDEVTANLTRPGLGQGQDVQLELKGLGEVCAYAPLLLSDQRLVGGRSFAKVPPP